MKKLWLLLTIVIVVALLALSPYSAHITRSATEEAVPDTAAAQATEEAAEYTGPLDSELSVYNWGDYIDEKLLIEYEDKYHVKIIYDNFATNEELFTKIQAGAAGYDVIFPTDYLIDRLIQLGLVQKLDKQYMPNFKNVDPYNMDNWFDPGALYCAPYMWSTSGIAYLKSLERHPDSWAAFFDPEQAKWYSEHGGINLLDDEREVIGAALQYLGYSYNDAEKEHLEKARDIIIAILPYVKYINSTDYQDTLMAPKEVSVSHTWAGSAAKIAVQSGGEWAYVVPKEGGARTQDGACIPTSSTRKLTAEHFINFLMDAHNAARNANVTGYATTNQAAREFIDPALLEFVPTTDQLEKIEWFRPLDENGQLLWDETWTEIRAGQ